MHHDHLVAIQVVQKLSYRLEDRRLRGVRRRGVPAVHRPALAADRCIEADSSRSRLGAQNCHWEDQGAFTGEVSPPMLAKLNVQLRDRRALRASSAVRRDRRDGEPEAQGGAQARDDADRVRRRDARGARGRATPTTRVDGQTRAAFAGVQGGRRAGVRRRLRADLGDRDRPQRHPRGRQRRPSASSAPRCATLYGDETADAIRIQYGGSVKPGNIADLMAMPEIDGAPGRRRVARSRRVRPDRAVTVAEACVTRLRLDERERPPVLNAILIVLDVIACAC